MEKMSVLYFEINRKSNSPDLLAEDAEDLNNALRIFIIK